MAGTSLQETRILKRQMANEGREVIDWSLYDSMLTTAAATQTLTFFQNTLGTTNRTRTNMKNAGALPNPQSFYIKSMSFSILNIDGTSLFSVGTGAGAAVNYAINDMMSRAWFDLVIDPSTAFEGHGSMIWDAIDRLEDAPASLLAVAPLGAGKVGKFKTIKFKYPILIQAQRSFRLNLTLTTPAAAGGYTAANTLIYCYLNGSLRRNS